MPLPGRTRPRCARRSARRRRLATVGSSGRTMPKSGPGSFASTWRTPTSPTPTLWSRSPHSASGLTVPELPELLATYNGIGYVVAPAGYGKTHLIASALQHAERRQLVLTHTYAGVNALRRKLRQVRVTDAACRIDTI